MRLIRWAGISIKSFGKVPAVGIPSDCLRVHLPGFDDVAEGIGHKERLQPATVLVEDPSVHCGVVHNRH